MSGPTRNKRVTSIFLLILFMFTLQNSRCHALHFQTDSNFSKTRLWIVGAGSVSVYGASLIGLNELWYKGYPRSSFHFFNDNNEWNQMDKAGHVLSAYYQSIIGIEALKWAGLDNKKAAIWGGGWGIIFQTPIEILDGFSSHWGASWGDFAANLSGSALAFSQALIWEEQKIRLKYSFHQTAFAPKRPDLLGENLVQNMIKDYNGMTLWLSFPVHDLLPADNKIPVWLDLSIGYGSEGMLAGLPEDTRPEHLPAYWERQFYLSFDINTLRIKTGNKYLKTFLSLVSVLKVPMPAFEFTDKGKFSFHPLYF